MLVSFNSHTTGGTCGAETANPSGAHEFIPASSGTRVTRSVVSVYCFVVRCLPFCSFSFGQFVVCSSIHGSSIKYIFPEGWKCQIFSFFT